MAELKYKENVLKTTGRTHGDPYDDDHLYMGVGQTRGQLMVCPELEAFVGAELQKETAAAKERRKMREERALAKTDNPGGGGGKNKK